MHFEVPSIITDSSSIPSIIRAYHGLTKSYARKSAIRVYNRTRVAEAQNWRCCYCGIHMTTNIHTNNMVTLDHAVPTSKGGSDSWDNWAAACNKCNQDKGDYHWEDFLAIRELKARQQQASIEKRIAKHTKTYNDMVANGGFTHTKTGHHITAEEWLLTTNFKPASYRAKLIEAIRSQPPLY